MMVGVHEGHSSKGVAPAKPAAGLRVVPGVPSRAMSRHLPALRRPALVASVLALGLAGSAAPAGAGESAYRLLSKATNGVLGTYAISQDQRYAALAAFSSTATNLVHGRGGSDADVFLVRRAGHFGASGLVWRAGHVLAPVHSAGGGRPNGNVVAPALNGGFFSPASCVAFISNATNLLPGNAAGQYDAYVEDLRTRRIRRVSVASNGAHANGPTDSVSVDGQCERVAFSSTATNLTAGAPRAARSVPPAAGTDEVYVRVLGARGYPARRANRGLVDKTFLVSANASGQPSNGPCVDAHMANYGLNLTYSCTASNLPGGNGPGTSQVYTTRLAPGAGSPRTGRPLGLIRDTSLVSQSSAGSPGDALSDHPAINADGTFVTYHSRAINLFSGATGLGDVIRADVTRRPPGQIWVSRGRQGAPNGDSDHPTSTYPGDLILFDSTASNIVNPGRAFLDDDNAPDVFLWGSTDRVVKLRSRRCYTCPPLAGGSTNPVTSYVANYTLFRHDGQLWMRYLPK